jgi:hypothetical protein
MYCKQAHVSFSAISNVMNLLLVWAAFSNLFYHQRQAQRSGSAHIPAAPLAWVLSGCVVFFPASLAFSMAAYCGLTRLARAMPQYLAEVRRAGEGLTNVGSQGSHLGG